MLRIADVESASKASMKEGANLTHAHETDQCNEKGAKPTHAHQTPDIDAALDECACGDIDAARDEGHAQLVMKGACEYDRSSPASLRTGGFVKELRMQADLRIGLLRLRVLHLPYVII